MLSLNSRTELYLEARKRVENVLSPIVFSASQLTMERTNPAKDGSRLSCQPCTSPDVVPGNLGPKVTRNKLFSWVFGDSEN